MAGIVRRVVAAGVVAATVMVMAATLASAQVDDPTADPPAEQPAGEPTTTTSTTLAPAPPEIPAADPPAAPTADPPPGAPIDGWVADADSGQPLGGICVVFYSQNDGGTYAGSVLTSGDGWWSFTPKFSGPYSIAFFRPSIEGDCTSMPLATGPVPEWAFDSDLKPNDPLTTIPPPGVAWISDGTTDVGMCLGADSLARGGCDLQPRGKASISGTVVQPGPLPVEAACVFVLAELPGGHTAGYGGMTDADGKYTVDNLSEDLDYYVAVIPPFEGPNGPCETEDGPPPVGAAGDLQPEMYADVWVDLTSPELEHPAAYAKSRGASQVAPNSTGIDVCLTTDEGSAAERSSCAAAAPSQAAGTDTTAAPAATAVTGTLPLTGGDPLVPAAVGVALVAMGAAGVLAARRRSVRHAR